MRLVIEASTRGGTVALLDGDVVVVEREVILLATDEERLMPAVAEVLAAAPRSKGVARIRGVVCGGGPGSFTPLRIAASIAKGLATATGVPLYAVSSLALAAADADPGLGSRVVVALDAMRGEVYLASADRDSRCHVMAIGPVRRVAGLDAAEVARELGGPLVGPDQALPARPRARYASRVLVEPVDLVSWEPDYGRLAEAQVRWEAANGRPLDAASGR